MDTQEQRFNQAAVRSQQEVGKIKRIDSDECNKEALEAKKDLMAFRATCVSMNVRSAVKVVDRTIAHINKMVAAYEAKVRS